MRGGDLMRAALIRATQANGVCHRIDCDQPALKGDLFCADCADELKSDLVRSSRRPTRRKRDWIYFFGGGGLIKIGKTHNINMRLASLRTMSPVPIVLIVAFEANERSEYILHQTFKDLREHGEWFRPEPALLRMIEKVKARDEQALRFMEDATGRILTAS